MSSFGNWGGPPEIAPNEIQKDYVLGDGSFGTVYKGKCRAKGVAVKVLHKQDLDPSTLAAFRQEVEMVSRIFHPNVVLFMGACTVRGSLAIVTELMPRGDLDALLREPNINLSLTKRMEMAKDAALGMNWLHCSHPPIIHRDLKCSNLLVDDNWTVKLADFGLSQVKNSDVIRDGDGARGTPIWMAPEVLMGQPFNEKVDVYSFGLVLWQILTRTDPFSEYRNFKEFKRDVCEKHVRPQIPGDTSPILRTLMEMCWHPDPSARPAFEVIISELEKCVIQAAIPHDHRAQRMWFSVFPKTTKIKFDEFFGGLLEFLEGAFVRVDASQKLPKDCPEHILQKASEEQLVEYGNYDQTCFHIYLKEKKRRAELEKNSTLENKIEHSFYVHDKAVVNCLKKLLVPSSGNQMYDSHTEWVTIEKFGDVCAWFGPLDLVESPRQGRLVIAFFENILQTLSKEWFFGFVSAGEAENLLSTRDLGSFLVRFSSNVPGSYAISSVSSDPNSKKVKIFHRRINRAPDGTFLCSDKSYPCLKHVIEDQRLGYHKPCPGSKLFNDLFVRKEEDESQYFGM